MDEIVQKTCDSTGYTKACSYCGVFRRQALNIGAKQSNADLIATGHNADDNAETGTTDEQICCLVIMNLFRGDINRLTRSGGSEDSSIIPRCKPLK